MGSLKKFINKVKEQNAKLKAKDLERKAKRHGFSSGRAYETFKDAAKQDGIEEAEKHLRKKELDRVKKEAKQDRLTGTGGKAMKIVKGIRKGAGIYNEAMSELKNLNTNDSMFPKNSRQAYASGGYGKKRSSRNRSPKKKNNKKSKRKESDFWSQFL